MGCGLGHRELVSPPTNRGVQIIGWGACLLRETRAWLGAVEERSTPPRELGKVDLLGSGAEPPPRLLAYFAGQTARIPASSAPVLVHPFSLPLLINMSHSFWLCTHKFEVEFLPGLSIRRRREGEKER